MLWTLVSIKKIIDISQVVAFLKRKSEEYRPKKSLTLGQRLDSKMFQTV
jgi:hypothetical protein